MSYFNNPQMKFHIDTQVERDNRRNAINQVNWPTYNAKSHLGSNERLI